MNRRAALPAFALSAFLLCASAAPGEEPASGSFGDKVTVTVVQVPVQVFKDGEPVRGLTEADFEVFDQGQRRELSYFEVVDLTETADQAAAPAEPRSEQAHRSLLVLFDLTFGDPRSLERARRGIAEMIDSQLHPADRVAIATYTPVEKAKLLLGFTSDRELLGSALDFLGTLFRGSDHRALAIARTSFERKETATRFGSDELARASSGLGPSAALALDGRLGPAREASNHDEGVASDGSFQLDPTANQKYFQEASQLAESFVSEAATRQAIAATRAFTESMSEARHPAAQPGRPEAPALPLARLPQPVARQADRRAAHGIHVRGLSTQRLAGAGGRPPGSARSLRRHYSAARRARPAAPGPHRLPGGVAAQHGQGHGGRALRELQQRGARHPPYDHQDQRHLRALLLRRRPA